MGKFILAVGLAASLAMGGAASAQAHGHHGHHGHPGHGHHGHGHPSNHGHHARHHGSNKSCNWRDIRIGHRWATQNNCFGPWHIVRYY